MFCDLVFGVSRLADGGAMCLTCGRQFSNPGNANRHVHDVHMEPKCSFACHICGKSFSKARGRADHLLRTHKISKQMLKEACPVTPSSSRTQH